MHILVVVPDSLLKPMGGMGEQARELLPLITDHHFTVLCSDPDGSYVAENITIVNTSCNATSMFLNVNGSATRMSSLLMQSDIVYSAFRNKIKDVDLVHAFDWSSAYASAILAEHYGVKFVFTLQLSNIMLFEDLEKSIVIANKIPVDSDMQNQMFLIERSATFLSGHTIQVSNSYLDRSPPIFRTKSSVVPNGIDLKKWNKKFDSKFEFPGDKNNLKVVYIGRYDYMKGIQYLLDAKIPEGVDIIFVGSRRGAHTMLYDVMNKCCEERENFYYIGPKYGNEKIHCLQSADAMIFPSIHEPFGIVGLEAFASNTLLLTTGSTGISEYANQNNSIIFEPFSASAIESALQKMLAMTQYEKNELIANAYKTAANFTWTSAAEKTNAVYNMFKKKKKGFFSKLFG